jgi:hypothetical protein
VIRLGHHRRFTANHTLHVDLGRRRLFVKVSSNPVEAAEEIRGHARLAGQYPVPALHHRARAGRWTLLAYQRVGGTGPDHGLLLDEITHADATGDLARLDTCLTEVLDRYRRVITATVDRRPLSATVGKLYTDRALPGGRLDTYYRDNRPLLVLPGGQPLRPAHLRHTTLVVNGVAHRIDFTDLVGWLRERLGPSRTEWAALTQGDPTDPNIGWTPQDGPIWFDYDTGGANAVPGEFACFLCYQHLHGGWLVPTYNRAAFGDHPAVIAGRHLNQPTVHIRSGGTGEVSIDYRHTPSPARRHAITRYHAELVAPLAEAAGITDLAGWLRPWLVMRILAVYRLGDLHATDAALCLAYLAEILHPDASPDPLIPAACGTGRQNKGAW